MNRIIGFLLMIILLGGNFVHAQVGIGTTTPNSSSILDLSTTSKGMLIPRMTLVQKLAIANPATGLLIYQTDGAVGFWYYNGSTWVPFLTSSTAWTTIGNSGTTDLTNFLGTTDNVPLSFKVNNVLAGRIDLGNSNVFLGYQSGLVTTGKKNAFFGHQAGKVNTSGEEITAIGFGAGTSNTTGTKNTFVGTNANAASGALTNATAIGSNASVSTSNSLVLGGTGGDAVNVGIGTTAPTTTLDVIGKTRTSTFQMTTNPVLNYALISDASGNGSWGDPTATAWKLTGNTGTTPGTHFIGTTDSRDFVTKTNNVEKMRVTSGGIVGIGTATPTVGSLLDVKGNIALTNGGTASEFRFYEPNASGTNYTAFKAQTQAANITYTLPSTDGISGQQLSTNGSGVLSWSDPFPTTMAMFVRKPVNESVVNSTTLQDDDDFTFNFAANKCYEVTMMLKVHCSNGAKIKMRCFAPNGSTAFMGALTTKGGNSAVTYMPDPTQAYTIAAAALDENTDIIMIQGTINTAGTPGVFKVQWAQATSDTDPTTIFAGSYIKAILMQ